jgi:hypothetical protein
MSPIACCLKVNAADARIIRIADTKHLEWFFASTPVLADLTATGRCEIVDGPAPIAFDATGVLTDPLPA